MPLRPQQDLTNEGCYNPASQGKVTLPQFRQLICDHCRNPVCVHAKWGTTPFDVRVQTWKERLFGEGRVVSDLSFPAHLQINENDFPDASRKALRLIVAAQRNDWEPIPDDDGTSVSDPSTTSKVDEAVKKLAEQRGQKAPEPPVPVTPEDELARDADEADKLMEDQADEELVIPEPEPRPEPEPEPQPEGWSEEELQRARRKDKDAGVNTRPPPSTRPGNTEMPAAGLMVGGEPPKNDPSKPVEDPWAPKKEKIIQPGSKVVLGGGKDGDDE